MMVVLFISINNFDLLGFSVPKKYLPDAYILLFLLAVVFVLFSLVSIEINRTYLGQRYKNDYLSTRRRLSLVAHVKSVEGDVDNISISDLEGVRKWFLSKFKTTLPFIENAALTLDVYQGNSIGDTDLLFNLKKSLSLHPINDCHFVGFASFNKENSVRISSSPLSEGKLEDGITLVFMIETSNAFYSERMSGFMEDLLLNQSKETVGLSRLFSTQRIARPVVSLELYDV